MSKSLALKFERFARVSDSILWSELSLRVNLGIFLDASCYEDLIPKKSNKKPNIQYLEDLTRVDVFKFLYKQRGIDYFRIKLLKSIMPYKLHFTILRDKNFLVKIADYFERTDFLDIVLPDKNSTVLFGDWFKLVDDHSFKLLDELFYLLEKDIIFGNFDIQFASFMDDIDYSLYQTDEVILLAIDLLAITESESKEWSIYSGYKK